MTEAPGRARDADVLGIVQACRALAEAVRAAGGTLEELAADARARATDFDELAQSIHADGHVGNAFAIDAAALTLKSAREWQQWAEACRATLPGPQVSRR